MRELRLLDVFAPLRSALCPRLRPLRPLRRAIRPLAIAVGTLALAAPLPVAVGAAALAVPLPAFAQSVLLQALEGTGGESDGTNGAAETVDALASIEAALSEARARLQALEARAEAARVRRTADGAEAATTSDPESVPATAATDAAEGLVVSPRALEQAQRLVRVLEQRRETQTQIDALAMGREAIAAGLARDPREIVGAPPPFPVPTFDGVLEAWQQASQQEERHRSVLADRRANLDLAGERVEDLDKERRRLRDQLERVKDRAERVRLEVELRDTIDELAIAREQQALAEQRVEAATIEHRIHEDSARQAEAALDWVRSQLAPRETDLTVAIERIDRERLRLEGALELANSRLQAAEASLRAAESAVVPTDDAAFAAHTVEVGTRRNQLTHRQRIVALLRDRIERLGRKREAWRHRYAVLGSDFDLTRAPEWRETAERELERLTRLRRIHETELAKADLAAQRLLEQTATFTGDSARAARFVRLELDDLERLTSAYRETLASLDSAIRLEERLRVELSARMKNRDLRERLRSARAAASAFWNYELTTSGDSAITPGKIVIALTIFFLGIYLSRAIRTRMRVSLFPRFGFDAGASSAFASLTFYGLAAIAFLLALRAVNIPLTAFAVAGGALAIGIGFGSQTVISNFISGLLILAERPIRSGDLVEVGGVVGTIESIGLRSTRIRTPDNFHIIVPNASFLESNVINWTHEDPMIRIRVTVGVEYGSPVRRVEELLLEAAKGHPRCVAHPPPVAIFSDFGDSALLFEVRFWIVYDERTDRTAIQSDLRYAINEAFQADGIVIAFPQMDVHLDVTPPATD